jgi:4,5-DOPA dioxygenase extradiol
MLRGCSLGGISMTCHGLDADCPQTRSDAPAADIPADVPPDQTNI